MPFRDFPIRRKLRFVILLTSGVVLLLTCAVFIVYEMISFRRAMREDLLTVARIAAENSTAALAFGNQSDAQKVLYSLRAEPSIVGAALYEDTGEMFVRYPESSAVSDFPHSPAADGSRFENRRLVLFQPVQEGNRRYGTIYLEADLGQLYDRLRLYTSVTLLVLGSCFVVAILLSNVLQKSISMPIISLAETAKKVSEKSDYTVRAEKANDDEIGLLTEAFNQMLSEIHTNQEQLSRALKETRKSEKKIRELNLDLERRVADRTAELEEAVAQMEAFSYSVSHDLRAPLRAMQGFSDAALEDYGTGADPVLKDYLTRIRDAAMRMDRLILDILAYSRMARSDLEINSVNVEKIARELVAQNAPFQPPQAEFIIDSPTLPVKAHEPALAQCLYNLMGNAVKFMSPGVKPKVRIFTDAVGDMVRIHVQDNGIGINPEYKDRIFGMFERIHKQSYEGTGIGLAIVKKSVARMGGQVGLESQEGKGSTFWIELPKG